MEYTIEWGEIEKFSYQGKEIVNFKGEFVRPDGSKFEAVIGKVDKEGKEFPNFDKLTPGYKLVGNEWASPKGKTYIFAPKAATRPTGASRGNNPAIAKMVERKNEAIATFQGNKEVSIKLAGAMRDAVLIVTTMRPTLSDAVDSIIQSEILKWRSWFLDNHGDMKDVIDPTK